MRSRAHPAQAPALKLEGADSQTAAQRQAMENSALDNINEIVPVHIEFRYTDPIIWRQIELPTSITLKVLHDIIQAVMGWRSIALPSGRTKIEVSSSRLETKTIYCGSESAVVPAIGPSRSALLAGGPPV